jgi:uncharacterized protein YgiM (DUF1202 family)
MKIKNTISTNSNDDFSSDYASVKSDVLNVRSGPSVNYEVLARLYKNTRVQIINKSGSWWKIQYENIEGYVNSEYLGN